MLDFSVTLIITIINIAILSIILKLILWKPVTKFMADRTRRIEDSIEQAKNEKAQAEALLAQYTAQLKNAEAEANAIIHNARKQAETEAESIIASGRASVEELLAGARKQLETEQKAAAIAFRQEAAGLVVAAASHLVGREINSEDNHQYATMLLNETGKC